MRQVVLNQLNIELIYMSSITFQEKTYRLKENETVLDCLLRHQQGIPFSCRSGVCQSCLLRAINGQPPKAATVNLRTTYQRQGYFLACRWQPDSDIEVALPDMASTTIAAEILSLTNLCHNVKAIRLKPLEAFECLPGQYINLINPNNVTRSYSIANLADEDGYIELHVRYVAGGAMTTWLFQQAQAGDRVHLRGPIGHCFYEIEDTTQAPDFPIVLVGISTGLAPLLGVIKDSLRQQHQGPIQLIHGGLEEKDLYLIAELQAMANKHRNFSYIPCAINSNSSVIQRTDIYQLTQQQLPITDQTRVYICGDPNFVMKLKKQVFLAGIASRNIFNDAFIPTKSV
ncbi:MAG: FAD-binding oxidoreductase [Gammaproteobacteria bacterium]